MLMKILIAGIALLAGTCSVVVLVLEILFVEEFLLTVEKFKIPCVSLEDGAKLVAVSSAGDFWRRWLCLILEICLRARCRICRLMA